MSREIKFRFVLKKENEITFAYYSIDEVLENIGPMFCHLEELGWELIAKDQFTCLLDKNGKEIYEGDILQYSCGGDAQSDPYIVEDIYDFHIQINRDDNYYRIDRSSLKIIGNIHQNPELLNN